MYGYGYGNGAHHVIGVVTLLGRPNTWRCLLTASHLFLFSVVRRVMDVYSTARLSEV